MTSPISPSLASLCSIAVAVLALGVTGCNTPQSTPAISTITIDTGATIPLSPGLMDAIDIEHPGGGHWEVHTTATAASTTTPTAQSRGATVRGGLRDAVDRGRDGAPTALGPSRRREAPSQLGSTVHLGFHGIVIERSRVAMA